MSDGVDLTAWMSSDDVGQSRETLAKFLMKSLLIEICSNEYGDGR